MTSYIHKLPILVAVRSKAQVCSRLIAGVAGSNPTGGQGCSSLVLHTDELTIFSEKAHRECMCLCEI
jgi:hypothetical protein